MWEERKILEEEVFYGGGKKGKEIQGGKRRRGLIKGKGDLGDQSKGKGKGP